MFDKILIANRGEIACRVIRTARRMGIGTVAVYSEADADALHVELADEAYGIGPPAAGESYLAVERIVDAIRRSGAQAVHPGYGFLSENAAFARTLAQQGVSFIGPPAGAIELMGDKLTSKRLAQEAGVNTVPGHPDAIADPEVAVRVAREIGYPVMIKASAGGGGKGMRIAGDDEAVRAGLTSAANEARSSFADDRVFLEKFIERPRHIEIQVLADGHGNCIYLGERECSIQRRHQKVLEEAPSPFLDAETRRRMGEQAVALARAVDYQSAGTVEFIVDQNKSFYFLEMNTRLQVEHPVTELVTGLDLVEQMIRVAAGNSLSIGQDEVTLSGWALESRIYAEDPYRDFMPSTGRLVRYRPPAESASVRVDAGVIEGAEITPYYDPMIAKLVTCGRDRGEAVSIMAQALDAYVIDGIDHNISFLSALVRHPDFVAGDISTAFIEQNYPDGFAGAPLAGAVRDAVLAAALLVHVRSERHARQISGRLPMNAAPPDSEWEVSLPDAQVPVSISDIEDGLDISEGVRLIAVRSDWRFGDKLFNGTVNGAHVTLQVSRCTGGLRLVHGGVDVVVSVRRPGAARLADLMPEKPAPDMSKYLLCPMPGLVVSIEVSEGEEVKAGQPLAIVEAMKMENVLRADRDGRIGSVKVASGDSLMVDEIILEFD